MSVRTQQRSAAAEGRRRPSPQERPRTPGRPAPSATPPARLDGRAAAALMLGGAGMFIFNIVFGPLAIVLGLRAARDPRGGRFGRLGGRLGVVLGILDLAILAVLLISRIGSDGLTWQLGG
ncbi:hypothetical protein ACGFI9_26830 [Micromonospora sp. NPDC048930]|uniref:hypothetical protein n=1 Tax=Micromonospora sp. NPDC048930 TaxID=3364261 RepID=UPI00371BA52C